MVPAARSGSGLDTHRLSERELDDLALGTIDPEILQRLVAAETSHRRIAFRVVLDLLREQPAAVGPLAPADDAWNLLAVVDQRDPGAVRTVIDRPFAGAWAARLLRRLRGGPPDGVPLWADIGYLHAMAAAAAIRAGTAADLAVPARRGVVHLPTLGHARLPYREPWETATVVALAGTADVIGSTSRVRVAQAGAVTGPPAWRPTRTARTVDVVIEDADPYRLADQITTPVWLPDTEIARWERHLAGIWRVLRDGHPQLAAGVEATVSAVVPLPAAQRFRAFSASSDDAFGSVELSEPDSVVDGAATLAHEFRHIVLGALMHLGDFLEPVAPTTTTTDLRYAPWRDDPRPARGVLQGIYAYFGVADFWRTQRRQGGGEQAMLAHFEFCLWRRAVFDTAAELLRSGPLTAAGRRFVTGLHTTVRAWLTEPAPVEARRLADLASADHRALWRAHHVASDAAAVQLLATAWSAGTGIPSDVPAVPAWVEPDPSARALDTRACLARLWLADRDAFRRLEQDGPHRVYRGASPADCALVAGDRERARHLYAEKLALTRGDRRALVGLGLALGGTDPAGRLLLDRPELAHAVTAAAAGGGPTTPRPAVLAAWLSPLAIATGSSRP